jgi:rod shape determining protein RodA
MQLRTPIKRITDRAHLGLLLATLAVAAFGTLMVWSATSGMALHDSMFKRHLAGLALGLVPLAALWIVDYQRLKAWAGPLLIVLALLVISPRIPGLGDAAKGATSWLQFAGIRLFQPSEPAKILFIIVFGAVISEYRGKIDEPRDVLKVLGYAALPVGLILLQPDLGTGMVFVAIATGMLLVGGLKRRYFVIGAVAGLLLLGLLLALPQPLTQRQKNRLLVFVDPSRDPEGAGYNLAQSKIAIGSGGLTGKGLRSGTQSNLNFLPERHTDFIFSVLGEQLGFLGAVLLLGVYLALLSSALSVSTSARDLFGALVAAGVLSMWLFQIVENIGMTIGLMPITGIPLPFMSYGSSAMVTNLAGVGMLLSVWSRRYGT